MWVATADLPRSAGHPFYERLNQVLDDARFDAVVEAQCAPFYADGMGRPWPPTGTSGCCCSATSKAWPPRSLQRRAAAPVGGLIGLLSACWAGVRPVWASLRPDALNSASGAPVTRQHEHSTLDLQTAPSATGR